MKKIISMPAKRASIFLALTFLTTNLFAGLIPGVLTVTATVLSFCTATLPSALAFGNYSGAQLDATATLTLTCLPGSAYTVTLDKGAGSGATINNRLMSLALTSYTLPYNIYQDAARTTLWGDTSGTWVSGTGTGLLVTLTLYGRILANQMSGSAGAYTDSVNIAVNY